jgi:hypothetical protein
MAELMFACPNGGRPVSTGIEVPAAEFETLPNQRKLLQCPYCRMLHGWMTKDGWLNPTEAEIAEACRESDRPQVTKPGDVIEI